MLLRNKKVTKKMMKSLTQELHRNSTMTREEIEEQYEDVVLGWVR
jgi:hypothetical protein